MRRTLLLIFTLVTIPLTAIAQEQTPPAPPTTPAEFHHAREAKMGQSRQTLIALKQAADSGADLAALAPRIEWLVQWSRALPTLFPEGSDVGSDARPEIWSDRAGFNEAAAQFQAAVQGLAAPAAANDHAAFLTAWTAVQASCGGCHDNYRN
jgi:cytochrome c556